MYVKICTYYYQNVGSEYSGIYYKSIDQLVEWHSSRYQVLADTNPDIMACETVPCKDEVKALLKVDHQTLFMNTDLHGRE